MAEAEAHSKGAVTHMSRQVVLDGKIVNDESDCFVIAEIGHNHMGRLDVCLELFRIARECGADAVKLQKRDNRNLYTAALYHQIYDNPNSHGETYGKHREALEFGKSEYAELKAWAKELGITFFATAFDEASADFLGGFEMPLYKIASADVKNIPLLRHIARFKKPMILSTGGACMEDVRRAVDTVAQIHSEFAILQCTAGYPCDHEELNLRVIETLRAEYPQTVIGFSDHHNGIAMSVAAFVLGARIVEKHFTLNRANRGTDHAFSLEPIGFRKMVRDLRRVRTALGDGIKRVYPAETRSLAKMAKAIRASRDLKAGTMLSKEDLALKSPGDKGLPPYFLEQLVGKILARDLKTDDVLLFEDLKPVGEQSSSGGRVFRPSSAGAHPTNGVLSGGIRGA
jgi:sialic acid synthase